MDPSESYEMPISCEPSMHGYLGSNLLDLYGVNSLTEEKDYELLIVTLPSVVLFPGETIPIRSKTASYISALNTLISRQNESCYIGIIDSSRLLPDILKRNKNECFGTCVEIKKTSSNPDELILIAKAKYRFKSKYRRRENGVLFSTVQILPELYPIPSDDTRNLSIIKSSSTHPFPLFIYNAISIEHLLSTAYQLYLKSLSCETEQHSMSSDSNIVINRYFTAVLDPIGFTYCLLSNIPFSGSERYRLLAYASIVEKLCFVIEYFQSIAVKQLLCKSCRIRLACTSDLITISGADGVIGAYVNPHGSIHQTLTLSNIEEISIHLYGAPSSEDSWFPGYSWTIVYCNRCFDHLGWLFTLESNQVCNGNHSQLTRFWGIRKDSIVSIDELQSDASEDFESTDYDVSIDSETSDN